MSRQHKKIVEYRIYELSARLPVLLLDGEDWYISDVKSNRLHFHNCFEVGICHSESGTMVFEDAELPFREGDVTCIPRHIAHTTFSSKGTKSLWSYLFIDFDKLRGNLLAAQGFAAEAGTSGELDFYCLFSRGGPHTQSRYPRIYFYVMSIVEEMRQNKPGYEAVVSFLLQALYIELLRLRDSYIWAVRGGGKKVSYALAPALDYIYANYMHRFPVDSLAEICHLSTAHFRREFLSTIGSTPLNFINTMRVEKACCLLLSTSDAILSIAEAVGFASISSFERCFMQIMGVSPRDYRCTAKNKEIKPEHRCILPYRGWIKAEEL
ncbi:MAG: AraC family transcriptional regulator [Clostridiales bacterium]|jgi:AraC-like DNA-binding protein|nr:AraC family transcriptional regulator [Clostridiales bacterium]